MLETARVTCPYCWEPNELTVDCPAGSAEFVEDCTVCCQPMRIRATVDGAGHLVGVDAAREND